MKKSSAILFAIFLALSLTACGGNNTSDFVETEPLGELTWPDSDLAALVPRPQSTVGEIAWEYDDEINILIGEVTAEDYSTYVNECKSSGFSEIGQEETTFFHATNADGYRLDLSFNEDQNQMNIIISEPLYVVQLEIDCLGNLLFSKYDIDVYVDYEMVGSIEHGGEGTYEMELEKGTHTLRIESQDDDAVNGEYEFEVPGVSTLRCDVSCTSDQVEIDVIEDVILPFSSSDLIGKPHEEVETMIENAGFWDVDVNPISDLTAENMTEAGLVTSVTIDGISEFSAGEPINPEAAIVIEYHAAAEYNPPYNGDTAEGMHYTDIVDAFVAAGFTNVTTEAQPEAEFWGYEEETVATIRINDEFPYLDKTYPADAAVVIKYYTTIVDEPATSLSSYYAHQAFREYGESQYPFGFDPHFIMDLRNEEQLDNGSWYIKVGVTITNAYGQEYETVAEGIVSGTDDLAVVTQFHVSN